MKKTIIWMAGVAVLGVAAYYGSRLSAQGPAAGPAKPAAPQTKIALVNLNFVIKNYQKYLNFQKTVQEEIKKRDTEIKLKATEKDNLAKQLQTDPKLTAAQKETIEANIRDLTRQVEDLTAKARRDIAKLGSDEMVKVYKEVRDASGRHALQHGFDLVLHFEEAATQEEFDSPGSIMRKMNAGGCVPLYSAPGMDVSAQIVQALNAAYKAATPAPAGGTPAAGGTNR